MKAYVNSTYGRNHYYYKPKEHTVPKSSKDRRGTRSSVRRENKKLVEQEIDELTK